MLCCSSPADSIGRGEGEHAPLPSWPRLSRDRARVGRLCHGSEYRVVPANTGTVLLVGRFRVAYLVEFRLQDPGRIVDDIKKKKSRQDRKWYKDHARIIGDVKKSRQERRRSKDDVRIEDDMNARIIGERWRQDRRWYERETE